MQMTQPHHRYIDLSDLNARYDQMAIQGLGGGSLGLGSSLGTATGLSGYPWNKYSADTAGLQARTNIALVASGYLPITVDGYLGPKTCGAVQTVLPNEVPSSCSGQASTAPTAVAPVATPAPTSAGSYPWNQFSADTRTLQVQTNAALTAQGYDLLATDGVLGPKTCGAVQAVAPSRLPSTCTGQASTAPTRSAASIAAAAAAAASAAAAAAAAAMPTSIPSPTAPAPSTTIPTTTTTIPSGPSTPVVAVSPTGPVPPGVPAVVAPSAPTTQAAVSNGGLPWGFIAGGVAVVGLGAFLVTRKK